MIYCKFSYINDNWISYKIYFLALSNAHLKILVKNSFEFLQKVIYIFIVYIKSFLHS